MVDRVKVAHTRQMMKLQADILSLRVKREELAQAQAKKMLELKQLRGLKKGVK